ncbi:hypothetical protein [Pseudomonas retamae]|uniref:Uncharacterized protein n=1 Tax=Pseudomonas retamae TaxID=702110 RepID=A0ABW7DAL1_9PSED
MEEFVQGAPELQAEPVTLDSISRFEVTLGGDASTLSKALYGNGRMQVKVQVLVSGVDVSGNYAVIPDTVFESIELVHYHTGKPLQDGWRATVEQGEFTSEGASARTAMNSTATVVASESIQRQVRTLWVSAEGAATTRIAARIFFNGRFIYTNSSSLFSMHDSSVTIESQAPPRYAIENFRWEPVIRGDEKSGHKIFNYYLGLYVQGQQIKLVDWVKDNQTGSIEFAYGNHINGYVGGEKLDALKGVLVRPDRRKIGVVLPLLTGRVTARDPVRSYSVAQYTVRVNDRDGELTAVVSWSRDFWRNQQASLHEGVFHFKALDQFGTEHQLAIRSVVKDGIFKLEQG